MIPQLFWGRSKNLKNSGVLMESPGRPFRWLKKNLIFLEWTDSSTGEKFECCKIKGIRLNYNK